MKTISLGTALNRFIPRSVLVFGIKIAGAGLAFATNVLVARTVPQDAAGLYFSLLSFVTLLFAVARFGFGYSTSKYVAAAAAKADGLLVQGIMNRSTRLVAFTGSLVTISCMVAVAVIRDDWMPYWPLWSALVMIAAVIPFSIASIQLEGIRGLRRSVNFALLDSLAFKATVVLFIIPLGYTFGIFGLALGYLFANALNLVLASKVYRGIWINAELNFKRKVTGPINGFRANISFAAISIGTISLQWAATFMVSALASPLSAAEYFVAFRTSATLEFVVLAMISVVGPDLVYAIHNSGYRAMLSVAARAALGAFFGTAILAVPMIIFSRYILDLFGHQYVSASSILETLSFGQVLAAPFSFGLYVLIADDRQRQAGYVAIGTAAFGLAAVYLGIQVYGTTGAAFGQAFSLVLQGSVFTATALLATQRARVSKG